MRILHVFDEKNYDPQWQKFPREAVRAIIVRDKRIALVKSSTDGFYKFPGGGIQHNENHIDALVRETKEETGLQIILQTIAELGMIHELRKSIHGDLIFDQKSYYYYADVTDSVAQQNLDDYEKDLGFELVWEDIEIAYSTNLALGENNCELSFLLREAYVLNLIKGDA